MPVSNGAANRRRGADAERRVVNWLRDHGHPNARRRLAGDGLQGTDIDGMPFVIEVKDRKSSSWPTWCAQAAREADRRGCGWVVVRRHRGNPNVAEWPTIAWGIFGVRLPATDHSLAAALTRARALGGWVPTREPGVYAGQFGWVIGHVEEEEAG